MNTLGNKVAFMGQIPVKVMGPVETGDYIVGSDGCTWIRQSPSNLLI